jgi:hypothetical protein
MTPRTHARNSFVEDAGHSRSRIGFANSNPYIIFGRAGIQRMETKRDQGHDPGPAGRAHGRDFWPLNADNSLIARLRQPDKNSLRLVPKSTLGGIISFEAARRFAGRPITGRTIFHIDQHVAISASKKRFDCVLMPGPTHPGKNPEPSFRPLERVASVRSDVFPPPASAAGTTKWARVRPPCARLSLGRSVIGLSLWRASAR